MSTYTSARHESQAVSGWTAGAYAFAGTILLMVGIFQIVAGIAAIVEDEFFLITRNYAFDVDVTAWGWIHLLVGVVVVLAGWGLFTAQTWARVVAVTVAVLSAVANFFFIPYYPFWALLIIALDVWVIWSLTKALPQEVEGG